MENDQVLKKMMTSGNTEICTQGVVRSELTQVNHRERIQKHLLVEANMPEGKL